MGERKSPECVYNREGRAILVLHNLGFLAPVDAYIFRKEFVNDKIRPG
jgi:hypothetical protein